MSPMKTKVASLDSAREWKVIQRRSTVGRDVCLKQMFAPFATYVRTEVQASEQPSKEQKFVFFCPSRAGCFLAPLKTLCSALVGNSVIPFILNSAKPFACCAGQSSCEPELIFVSQR